MSPIWLGALVGAAAVTAGEIVAYVGRRIAPPIEVIRSGAGPSLSEQIQYWLPVLACVIAPVVAVWIAASVTTVRVWGVALLVLAGLLLLIGLATVSIPMMRGRQAFLRFVANVERRSRTSFKALARLWVLAIVVTVLAAIRRLTTQQ
jgi:hypothetical protein